MDLKSHLTRQIAWSRATFGPAERREGVIEHIQQELQEIKDGDGDPAEWVDVVILAFDGLWRAINARHLKDAPIIDPKPLPSPDLAGAICRMLKSKQSKNETRVWPDWRGQPEDRAINHDRSKPE